MSQYENYSDWKGWENNNNFGFLDKQHCLKFKAQFEKLSIQYKFKNVLEIGFGNGEFLHFLKIHSNSVEGVEIQDNLINAANLSGVPAHDDLNKVINKPYDLIFALDVLEHLSIEQIKDLLVKLKDILKDDGKLIFRFPNVDSFMGLSSQNGDYTHITAIGRSKLEQIIFPLDLKIIKYEGAVEWPRNILKGLLRKFLRKSFMKLLGFGNDYFFFGEVIVVIEKK